MTRSDRLEFDVFGQSDRAMFTADTAGLKATERGFIVAGRPVDVNNAGTDGPGHLNPVREVRRPYATIKPVRRVVCQPDGLLLGVVRDDDDDGPEDLLLSDGHRVVDVGKERRPDVEALGERGIIERLEAAGDDAPALVDTLLDVALDLVPLASRTIGPT